MCTYVLVLDELNSALCSRCRWLVTRGEFGADEYVNNVSVHLPPEKVCVNRQLKLLSNR